MGFWKNIFARGKDYFIPAVFALLPRKSRTAYEVMMSAVIAQVDHTPIRFYMDLERAMISVLDDMMTETSIKVCLFHWKQCLFREVCAKQLRPTLEQNAEFDTLMNLIYVMPFVPSCDVMDAWKTVTVPEYNEFKDSYPTSSKNFMDYIQRTYIGTKNRCPMYEHAMWSAHDSILEDCHLTNNAIESFNRSFNISATRTPNVWRTIESFQREDRLAKLKCLQIRRGDYVDSNPGRKQEVKDRYEKIKQIMHGYQRDCMGDFFQALIGKV